MSYVGDRILNAVVVIGFRHFRKQSSPFMWSFTDTEMGQRMNIEDTQGAVLAGLLRKAHIRHRCRDRFALALRVHIGTSPDTILASERMDVQLMRTGIPV